MLDYFWHRNRIFGQNTSKMLYSKNLRDFFLPFFDNNSYFATNWHLKRGGGGGGGGSVQKFRTYMGWVGSKSVQKHKS